MPIYSAVGDALVSPDELLEKRASGELDNFLTAWKDGRSANPVKFRTGQLTKEHLDLANRKNLFLFTPKVHEDIFEPPNDRQDLLHRIVNLEELDEGGSEKLTIEQTEMLIAALEPDEKRVPWVEIGMGKPLTIDIRRVYTGRHPVRFPFFGKDDMLVTTAMKSRETFDAAPRALNIITKGLEPMTHVLSPAATEKGTPLVYYTPAVTSPGLILTVEVGFDQFDWAALGDVSQLLKAASKLPVFLSLSMSLGPASVPASVLLLAAGLATNIGSDLAKHLIPREPVLKATEQLDFLIPGNPQWTPGLHVLVDRDVPEDWPAKHDLTADGVLVVKETGHQYQGANPYVVISLDGRENEAYDKFIPTAASAALLERFYGLGDRQGSEVKPLLDAVELYNDWTFRREADELKEKRDSTPKRERGTEEYKKLTREYEAAVKNIRNKLLRP